MTESFKLFYGGICSQWYRCDFIVESIDYNCAEQYMMHQKAILFGDTEIAERIMSQGHPRDQKSLGRKVRGFDAAVWNAKARDIVYKGNWHKFFDNRNADIKQELLSYKGMTLVEASPYDKIWGIGLSEHDERALDRASWEGTNWLGEVLDSVRDDLEENRYRIAGFNWTGTPYEEPQFISGDIMRCSVAKRHDDAR